MRIGLTYNVRQTSAEGRQTPPGQPGCEALALPRDDDEEEFDSRETIDALAGTIASLGHDVELLGDGEEMLRRLFDGPRPDLVWNMAEGTGQARSREARVPAVLEMLRIPYTGSDPLTLAATLDKDCAKRLVAGAGVATPRWAVFDGDWPTTEKQLAVLEFPLIAKPVYEGSSKGILSTSVLYDHRELERALEQLSNAYRQSVLVEEFIDGDELTVGLVGNAPPEVLGIMRVLPRGETSRPFVYGLDVKRDFERQVRYDCPATLAARDAQAVRQAALCCWRALGCRDMARLDFRLRQGMPFFLEANPLAGLSPASSDLVLLAGFMGIGYRELIARILDAALSRLNLVGQASLVG
jgi:D-alanine-D-alanine ligase